MSTTSYAPSVMRGLALGAGVAAGAYAIYAGVAFCRYEHPLRSNPHEQDELLDRFIPVYDVAERHHIHVAAPPSVTLEAARDQDLLQSPLVRAIFKTREMELGAAADDRPQPRGLLAAVTSLGWGVLADAPGREVVMGAITKPWEASVTFRALPPHEFASFSEPGFVKIAWTLRADPLGDGGSLFRTETRAVATDATARARFRRYWAFASPGIVLIRRLSLGPLKRDAERRGRGVQVTPGVPC